MLSLRQLFDFVTDPNVADDNIDLYLDKVWTHCWSYLFVYLSVW